MADEAAMEVPTFEEMVKADMVSHLKDFHLDGKNLSFAWSTYTKGDLIKVHNELHQGRFISGNAKMIPHVHSSFNTEQLSGSVQAQLDALGIDTPLTPAQKKNLLDLLNNDFATLSAEMDVFGDELMATRKAAVKAKGEAKAQILHEFNNKGLDLKQRFDAEIRAVQQRYDREAQQLLDDAEKEGLTPRYGTSYQTRDRVNSFTVKGLDAQFAEIERETRAELAVARNKLQREKLVATRKIMLAAIPKDSAKLIDKMPSAAGLMRQAQAEREATAAIEASVR
jgi:hypothetical protein